MPFEEAVGAGLIRWLEPEIHDAYLAMNQAVSLQPRRRSARVVFTPLHGTGFHSAGAALRRAGFQVELYPEQATPDGTFPNVPFRSPNPEVPQSLTGASDFAAKAGADLVLGTDPDADRLGMVAPHKREWVFFNGNEIGVVLIHYMLSQDSKSLLRRRPFAVTTVVTTSLFSRIARAKGVQVIDNLCVGFKYIADVMNNVERLGSHESITGTIADFLLAIEESHGYLVTPGVRDKDAAGAAVLLAEVASQLKDEGRSLVDYANDIYREFGYVSNFLVSTVMQGARGFLNMRKIQDGLRASPPAEVGRRRVLEVTDRWDESGRWGKIKSETDRMSRDLLTFRLEGDARITLRPSGTESKNKIYVEVAGKPLGRSASDPALKEEKERLDREAKNLGRAFTMEMLSRIDVHLPDYALEVSDLVPLECKQDLAGKLLPELVERLQRGEAGEALEAWIDGRLRPYGADGRLLVREAVRSYLQQTAPPSQVVQEIKQLFAL
jgi:phosphoglucomutase/phosphomannomutase